MIKDYQIELDVNVNIPKIIHQIFFNGESLPLEIINSIDKLKILNPDWEYKIYDDAAIFDFVKIHYGDVMLNHIKKSILSTAL